MALSLIKVCTPIVSTEVSPRSARGEPHTSSTQLPNQLASREARGLHPSIRSAAIVSTSRAGTNGLRLELTGSVHVRRLPPPIGRNTEESRIEIYKLQVENCPSSKSPICNCQSAVC